MHEWAFLEVAFPFLPLNSAHLTIHKHAILHAMKLNIALPTDQLNAFCERHHIYELSLFGSVLRDDFKPQSDVDVLVEFESGVAETLTLMDLAGMQIELSDILQREVDLVLRDGLKPLLKDEILAHSEVVYAV
jgi:predicted nucleotidyltransferase